jgi:hypothetical protein
MPGTYDKIAVVTANGSANTYTFSSIPQTYTDLVFITNATNAQNGGNVSALFNSDSAGNYSRTFFGGDGVNPFSGKQSNAGAIFGGGTSPSGAFVKMCVFNYSNTTTFKTVILEQVEPFRLNAALAGLWRNTSAITTVQIVTQSALNAGQILTLYGIKAA